MQNEKGRWGGGGGGGGGRVHQKYVIGDVPLN